MTDPNPIRRGDVRQLDAGRWVVISSDEWNDAGGPITLAPIVRRQPDNYWHVHTADADPTGGTILITEFLTVDRTAIGPLIGILTGATMARLAAVVRAYFEL